ncbi:hypothetical protein AB0I34_14005 [Kribbella sp. NPDC050281]|uniref:DUF7674 family protein n=1 Tax=Kribbella sp. NPDC050281 TaxID=3155515 RepID=UPI0033D39C91
MSDAADAFLARLLETVPPLRGEWESYVRSHRNNNPDGTEPPRLGVFLLMLAESTDAWFRSGDPMLTGRLGVLLRFLESELGVDPEIDELIETRFAGSLPEPGDAAEAMLDLLGPRLRAARTRRLLEDDEAVPGSTVAFLHRLAEAVPALRGRVAGHFERLHGRPLPHVFMGEIVFEAVDLVASGRGQAVRPLIDFLESEYGVDADVDNVIDASFVEMLPDPGERGAEIESLLGPKLRAELERQRSWPDPPPEPTA